MFGSKWKANICVWRFLLLLLLFFFFFFWCTRISLFRRHYALFTGPKTTLFIKQNIKNRSHGTIHIFKTYFATVFSVFIFQQNKLYPNIHIIQILFIIWQVKHSFFFFWWAKWQLKHSISMCQLRFNSTQKKKKKKNAVHIKIVATPGIFSRVFLNNDKLHNLIKKEIHILTPTTTKKHANSYLNEDFLS